MNVVIAVFAAAAALFGLFLLWRRQVAGKELALMHATPTSKAGNIADMALGSLVKLQGTLRSATPLTAEFSQKACLYYSAMIEREYDEAVTETDNENRVQYRTERRTEAVWSQVKYASDAFIDDDSGKIPLNFEGAKVEAIESHRRRESATSATVETIRRYRPLEAASLFGKVFQLGDSGTRSYTFVETMLPPDIPIFVLGTVLAGGGIGAHKPNIYVISHKSEEQRAKDLISSRRWMLGFGLLFLVVAGGLAVWALR